MILCFLSLKDPVEFYLIGAGLRGIFVVTAVIAPIGI